MENEKQVDKKVVAEVKKIGGWCFKLPAVHVSGLPDRLCLFQGGRMCFLEIKGTGLAPTKLQLHIHQKLTALGFSVYVVDSYEAVKELIAKYK